MNSHDEEKPTVARETAMRPIVLMGQADEGYTEYRGWVEAIVPEDVARDLLAPFCVAWDGMKIGARPIGPAKRVWLAPDANEGQEPEHTELWLPSHDGKDPGARQFYEFDATDTEAPS